MWTRHKQKQPLTLIVHDFTSESNQDVPRGACKTYQVGALLCCIPVGAYCYAPTDLISPRVKRVADSLCTHFAQVHSANLC